MSEGHLHSAVWCACGCALLGEQQAETGGTWVLIQTDVMWVIHFSPLTLGLCAREMEVETPGPASPGGEDGAHAEDRVWCTCDEQGRRAVMSRQLSYKVTGLSGTTSAYGERLRRNAAETDKTRKGIEQGTWVGEGPKEASPLLAPPGEESLNPVAGNPTACSRE